MKLGYKASAEQFAPAALLEFACLAEEVGFDSVFISDHFQPWKHTDGHAPFSLAWLGALGAKTSRIVMGTSVLTPTFRYHPSIVAQAFGTLGSLFPGRVILGVGTGESLNEVPATGNPWPEFKERFARLRESIALIQRLWTEERVTFDGEYYRTRNATIYDRPAVPVPIYVAAALHRACTDDRLRAALISSGKRRAAELSGKKAAVRVVDAIAAVVIGGTSLAGGSGTIGGTIIGALIIGVLNNGMSLLGVSSFYQLIIKGLIISLAVWFDVLQKKNWAG